MSDVMMLFGGIFAVAIVAVSWKGHRAIVERLDRAENETRELLRGAGVFRDVLAQYGSQKQVDNAQHKHFEEFIMNCVQELQLDQEKSEFKLQRIMEELESQFQQLSDDVDRPTRSWSPSTQRRIYATIYANIARVVKEISEKEPEPEKSEENTGRKLRP